MKITDIRWFASEINDEVMRQIAESVNDGFEILKLDTSWNNKAHSKTQLTESTSCVIAILVKAQKE